MEDEALFRHDVKEGLVAAEFDVTDVAQDGKALSELEADPSYFTGLIMDINLGGGLDGRDAHAAENSFRTCWWCFCQRTRLGRLDIEGRPQKFDP